MENKITIWDKYTHINEKGQEVTSLKGIINQLHGEIQMLHEAMSYVASIVDKDNKTSIILKPDIIF